MKITASGHIEKGKLKIRNRMMFDNELLSINGEVLITIEKASKKRSNQQNRYYWGVVVPLMKKGLNDLGHELTEDDIHEYIKSKFNPQAITLEDTGEYFSFGRSTTELNTSEFMDMLASIQQFAAEILNVIIPDPVSDF